MIRAEDRALGRVVTPVPAAAALVARTLGPLVTSGRGLRVLDPACGDGVFLVEAARFLRSRGARAELVGADVDAAAVARAQRRVDADLRVVDALACDWGDERFDAVIGNPPWISWSGRHAQRLPAARRAFLAERFESFSGWPCAHAPFAELAVRLSRGRAGLVLPAQVCDLDGYGALRALLRREGVVEEPVNDLGEEAFRGVVQPACALVWERRAGGAPGGGAPFALRVVDEELVALLADRPRPPPGTFRDCGVHTGNCARVLVGGAGAPVREGRDVAAWRVAAPRRRLRVDYEAGPGEYFRIPPLACFRSLPIVLRQTASRPVAAPHREPTYFRNSVLGCAGVPGVEPALVLAWLNSDVIARYHAARVREAGQRAFPQVKVRHLQDLPMPDWCHPPRGLVTTARRASRDGAEEGLRARIDALVALWFDLPGRSIGDSDCGIGIRDRSP